MRTKICHCPTPRRPTIAFLYSAGRLYQSDLRVIGDVVRADARHKRVSFGGTQKFRKFTDAVKDSVRREALLIKRLHSKIYMNQQLTLTSSDNPI